MSDNTMLNEAGEYAVRAGPATVSTSMHFLGYGIADWVSVTVLIYTILQIARFLYKELEKKNKDTTDGS